MQCPKCNQLSGDGWDQCAGSCPMEGSPYYVKPPARLGRYQPMQPMDIDASGTARFRENSIVRYLLDNGGIDLNQLARIEFPKEDRDQFTQLIGYSISGAPVSADIANAADTLTEQGVDTDRARIVFLEKELARIREVFREPVALMYNIHPDDLGQ